MRYFYRNSNSKIAVKAFVILLSSASLAQAQTSTITVTVEAPLDGLKEMANNALPTVLHEAGPRREVCIQAEEVCTKIPEIYDGFRIRMRNQCVQITPRVRCNVTERVTREGNLEITGSGNTLQITQSIRASVRAEEGPVRQTARAQAALSLSLIPDIAEDWSLSINPTFDYRWIDPPEFNLFGMIPITIRGEVEPEIAEAIEEFSTQTLPQELERLDLRNTMESFWAEIQNPIPIDWLHGAPPIFLQIRPEEFAFSGFDFSNQMVRFSSTITSEVFVSDQSPDREISPTALPRLTRQTFDPAPVSLQIPIALGFESLNETAAEQASVDLPLPIPGGGSIKIDGLQLSSSEGRLVASLQVDARADGVSALLGRYEGRIFVYVDPQLNETGDTLILNEIELAPVTNNFAKRWMISALSRGFLSEGINIDLAPLLSGFDLALNSAVSQEIADGLRVESDLSTGVRDLVVETDGVRMVVTADGSLSVRLAL